MTDTPRLWDRRAESDPAFEAFAAYLETGSLRDAYRQRSGKAQATAAPGAWTGWSTKYNWVSHRSGVQQDGADGQGAGQEPGRRRQDEAILARASRPPSRART